MDYKKTKAPVTTKTRNLMDFADSTGNIYESVVIMGKRANQIASDIKTDLTQKLKEFGGKNDSLEEEFDNREQTEISRYYERMPKPSLIAEQEMLENQIYFRNPREEKKFK